MPGVEPVLTVQWVRGRLAGFEGSRLWGMYGSGCATACEYPILPTGVAG